MARLSNLLRNIVLWKLLSEIRQSAGRGEQDAAVKPASTSGMTEPSEAQQVHIAQQLLCLLYLLFSVSGGQRMPASSGKRSPGGPIS